ncbi:Carboxylesterase [Handroanthus impetiginosus]|uniref:Carboxylesterase n=1 Tax=Handroanthus impetiginosus TaxID=429701 RepID=A0A2G9H5Z7_9LAMI|nr:Carboxylesterase [Handroanthus impetiginosus]
MDSNSTPEVVEDCFGILKLYTDGAIFRSSEITHRNPRIHDDGSAVWKDSPFDINNNLYLRLYKPKSTHSSSGNKLPIICYFHAGGFCFGSRTYPNAHNSCLSLCSGIGAVVVSADYRLAPENRLPAALEDGGSALKWLRDQALTRVWDEWLGDVGVDFEKVFVLGDSSGGNMAHHLAVELGEGSPELAPVRIRGYVLLSPFFGGTERTKSEEERPHEEFWSQEIYDRFWRLAVPI